MNDLVDATSSFPCTVCSIRMNGKVAIMCYEVSRQRIKHTMHFVSGGSQAARESAEVLAMDFRLINGPMSKVCPAV